MAKILDENYYQISGWMINGLELKGAELQVYAIIYGFTQDGESEFRGSIDYLCQWLNVSRPTISKALSGLVEKGLIIKRQETINGVVFNRYKISLLVVKNLYGGSKETLQGGVKNLYGGSKETLHNNNIYNNNIYNNIDNNNILCGSQKIEENEENEKVKPLITEIIEYLNNRVGTQYKPNSKETKRHINARIEEGFTFEQFKDVIDKKANQWIGTEYEQYLRPSTLFGTKFESYLNASVPIVKNETKKITTGNPFFDLLKEEGKM